MAEADLNGTIDSYRGAIGDVVFKRVRGKQIVTKKPVFDKEKKPSPAQRAWRGRFKEAGEYAKMAQDDPVLWAVYEPVAEKRQIALYTVAVKDFMNPPKIRSIYLMSYHGNPGERIGIWAEDDFGLAEMEVRLTDLDGTVVERGPAVEEKPRSGSWCYQTTAAAAPGTRLLLEVTGRDYAGNRVRVAEEFVVGEPRRIDIKVEPRPKGKKRRRPQPRTAEAAPVLQKEDVAPICEVDEAVVCTEVPLEAPSLAETGQPEEAGVVPAPLCETVQAAGHAAESIEGPYIPSTREPAEADGGPCVRETEETEVPLAVVMGEAAERDDAPAGPVPLVLAGASPQRLPVRWIWWALLAAVRLRAEGVAGRVCRPELTGGPGDVPEMEKQSGDVMKRGLAPP